jgi:aerobic-type carbon monoxide dehydrogenase small subunit (CoxS/CutS family)
VSHRRQISVVVNGNRYEAEVEARKYLAEFLREDLRLVGTHIGCEHGVCGACTVLMDGVSVRSCIVLAAQADEAEIMTVEDLASNGQMHPLQEAFWEKQGLQCGYCTPGVLVRAYELLQENPEPTAEEVREGMSNNLCRCTGYQYIVEAILAGAERMRNA